VKVLTCAAAAPCRALAMADLHTGRCQPGPCRSATVEIGCGTGRAQGATAGLASGCSWSSLAPLHPRRSPISSSLGGEEKSLCQEPIYPDLREQCPPPGMACPPSLAPKLSAAMEASMGCFPSQTQAGGGRPRPSWRADAGPCTFCSWRILLRAMAKTRLLPLQIPTSNQPDACEPPATAGNA